MQINKKAFSNFSWKFAEQICTQIVQFIVSVVLARILLPEDYSVVSIIAIITSFCNVFIEGGLSKALVQKKDSDILDYSTVLYTSYTVSFFFYICLFIAAPYIASIYKNQLLIRVIRIYALSLFITPISTIQYSYISKKLQFRKLFWASFIGTVLSGVIGIYLANSGFGAWALVGQRMIDSFVDTLIIFFCIDLRPTISFSFDRLKRLWKYGSKVLGTSIVDMIYDNIRPLIVGLQFSTADLAYYEKGRSYPNILNSAINSTLSAVLFPLIVSVQDDYDRVKSLMRRFIRVTSFVLFPTLLGLAAVANNLVILLITDKWIGTVPYIRIFCVFYMFQLLQTGNLQALFAIGRSDIVFKLAVIKKSINFILLFILILFSHSPYLLAALGILTSLIAYFINALANKKLLNYGLFDQLIDIMPNLFLSLAMYFLVYYIGYLNVQLHFLLLIQVLLGCGFYILMSFMFKNSSLLYILSMIKGKTHR